MCVCVCCSASILSCTSVSGMSWEPGNTAANRRILCTPSMKTLTPSTAAVRLTALYFNPNAADGHTLFHRKVVPAFKLAVSSRFTSSCYTRPTRSWHTGMKLLSQEHVLKKDNKYLFLSPQISSTLDAKQMMSSIWWRNSTVYCLL